MTDRSKVSALRLFLVLKINRVTSGPNVTSTPSRISKTCCPPTAAKYGCGYQSSSMRASTAAAMTALTARCMEEAFQRDITVEDRDVARNSLSRSKKVLDLIHP